MLKSERESLETALDGTKISANATFTFSSGEFVNTDFHKNYTDYQLNPGHVSM